MTVEIISWSISMKVWDRAGIERHIDAMGPIGKSGKKHKQYLICLEFFIAANHYSKLTEIMAKLMIKHNKQLHATSLNQFYNLLEW